MVSHFISYSCICFLFWTGRIYFDFDVNDFKPPAINLKHHYQIKQKTTKFNMVSLSPIPFYLKCIKTRTKKLSLFELVHAIENAGFR